MTLRSRNGTLERLLAGAAAGLLAISWAAGARAETGVHPAEAAAIAPATRGAELRFQVVQLAPSSQTEELFKAVERGDAAAVEQWLRSGADVGAGDRDGWTALMHAAFGGHGRIVKVLLNAGADVDAVSNHGETALIVAARQGLLEIVGLLLDHGADVTLRTTGHATAASIAEQEGFAEIAGALKAAETPAGGLENGRPFVLSRTIPEAGSPFEVTISGVYGDAGDIVRVRVKIGTIGLDRSSEDSRIVTRIEMGLCRGDPRGEWDFGPKSQPHPTETWLKTGEPLVVRNVVFDIPKSRAKTLAAAWLCAFVWDDQGFVVVHGRKPLD